MTGFIECAGYIPNATLAVNTKVLYNSLFSSPQPIFGCGYIRTHGERSKVMNKDYGRSQPKTYLKTDNRDKKYIDYKSVEDLRRLMTPNGKIYSRKRLSTSAKEQRMVAQAIKRARYMALLPFTSGTM